MHKLSVLVPLIAALALATSADANEGKPDVMGTVTVIEEHRIEVKTLEGKIVSAHVTISSPSTERGSQRDTSSFCNFTHLE